MQICIITIPKAKPCVITIPSADGPPILLIIKTSHAKPRPPPCMPPRQHVSQYK